MLDFVTQKKLLEPILKNPQNHFCADCDSISPTWASLDFGVLLCSNCSGAHRALGPTITRVRSANLDLWQRQWLNNMNLGNQTINAYWENNPQAFEKKPKASSSLTEIARYVQEKYIKKRYVKNGEAKDPLTAYKKGEYTASSETKQNLMRVSSPQNNVTKSKSQEAEAKTKLIANRQNQINLLDFDQIDNTSPLPNPQANAVDDDDFTEFSQATQNGEKDLLSFDTIFSLQKTCSSPPQAINYDAVKHQTITLHHPYNSHIGQNNLVYNSHFQYQSMQPGYFGVQNHAMNYTLESGNLYNLWG